MNPDLIFIPILIQVLLTFFVFIRLGQVKERAVKSGDLDQSRRALHDDAWPDYVLKVTLRITPDPIDSVTRQRRRLT